MQILKDFFSKKHFHQNHRIPTHSPLYIQRFHISHRRFYFFFHSSIALVSDEEVNTYLMDAA